MGTNTLHPQLIEAAGRWLRSYRGAVQVRRDVWYDDVTRADVFGLTIEGRTIIVEAKADRADVLRAIRLGQLSRYVERSGETWLVIPDDVNWYDLQLPPGVGILTTTWSSTGNARCRKRRDARVRASWLPPYDSLENLLTRGYAI